MDAKADLSHVMRKLAHSICENRGIDQLGDNCVADQLFCFSYIESAIPIFPKPLAIHGGFKVWFVSDLVENPENRFSRYAAHILAANKKDTNKGKSCNKIKHAYAMCCPCYAFNYTKL